MRYVVAGYVVILTVLFLYAVQLLWRRRRLTRAVARTASASVSAASSAASAASGLPTVGTAPGRPA